MNIVCIQYNICVRIRELKRTYPLAKYPQISKPQYRIYAIKCIHTYIIICHQFNQQNGAIWLAVRWNKFLHIYSFIYFLNFGEYTNNICFLITNSYNLMNNNNNQNKQRKLEFLCVSQNPLRPWIFKLTIQLTDCNWLTEYLLFHLLIKLNKSKLFLKLKLKLYGRFIGH